jgi:hypothetical protein
MHGGLQLAKNQKLKVHDRIAADLPINAVVAKAVVDDPYSTLGEKITVLRSVRDDPLAGMHSRRQIDDAMLAAGRMWQRYHEHSEIGGVSAIDPAKEAVDGGRIPEPITDRQIKAFRELARADRELGQEGCALVRDILGKRMSIGAAAHRRGLTSVRQITYLGRRFRESLDILAKLWGLASK